MVLRYTNRNPDPISAPDATLDRNPKPVPEPVPKPVPKIVPKAKAKAKAKADERMPITCTGKRRQSHLRRACQALDRGAPKVHTSLSAVGYTRCSAQISMLWLA